MMQGLFFTGVKCLTCQEIYHKDCFSLQKDTTLLSDEEEQLQLEEKVKQQLRPEDVLDPDDGNSWSTKPQMDLDAQSYTDDQVCYIFCGSIMYLLTYFSAWGALGYVRMFVVEDFESKSTKRIYHFCMPVTTTASIQLFHPTFDPRQ